MKHGHWISYAEFERCSECGGTQLKRFDCFYGKAEWIKTAYCPNCGAKMDKKLNKEAK